MSVPFPDIRDAVAAAIPGLKGRLSSNQPLADLTWLRVGGPAQLLYTPSSVEDLALFFAHLPVSYDVTVLGVGSNVIVRDGGIPGIVIRLAGKAFGTVTALEGGFLKAGAAALDKRVADVAFEAGIGGLEFYAGIPGTVGGALRMNAGANGSETRDVLIEAEGVDRAGRRRTFPLSAMGLTYRHSAVPDDVVFTSALFRGVPRGTDDIRQRMDEVRRHRETVQPVKERTGGSTFKNPTGHSAWKLIDVAGLRGFRIGGAHMSRLHCNFLINDAEATAWDVETLGETVRRRVHEATGVRLDWEIKRLGVFAHGRAVAPAF